MNVKSLEQQAFILRCLVEGNSLRSAARLSGAARNTVGTLLCRVGEACWAYQHENLINLPCQRVQIDEIWSFVGCKDKNAKGGNGGSVWTWTALCPDTKLSVCWAVGGRHADTAKAFVADVASRMSNRIQLTSDGFHSYPDAVETAFGPDVDFAQLVKQYGRPDGKGRQQYIGATKDVIIGAPNPDKISTSHVERANLTMRMSIRRFTRKTNAYSKKIENHAFAVALHFMHYNFVRIHGSLRVTPAMEAGVTDRLWDVDDIVRMTDEYWESKKV